MCVYFYNAGFFLARGIVLHHGRLSHSKGDVQPNFCFFDILGNFIKKKDRKRENITKRKHEILNVMQKTGMRFSFRMRYTNT